MGDGNSKPRVAVLVSGSGTNLQALLDRERAGSLQAQIVVVLSDRPNAMGLERAQKARVPTHVVNYERHLKGDSASLSTAQPPVDLQALDEAQGILKTRDSHKRKERLRRLVSAEQELIAVLDGYAPDYICLAGYMRLLTPYLIQHYNREGRHRILNIHPALLPAFPGQHGYEDTFAYGCKWGGVTVHFVDEGEDTGPIIAQAVYPIWPQDELETIRQRGLRLEYSMFAQCVNWLAAGQVALRRSSDGRLQTVVTDPDYPAIIQSWLESAMQ